MSNSGTIGLFSLRSGFQSGRDPLAAETKLQRVKRIARLKHDNFFIMGWVVG